MKRALLIAITVLVVASLLVISCAQGQEEEEEEPEELVDLTLESSDIKFSPTNTTVGQPAEISAEVHNVGDGHAESVVVQFFEGNPDTTGTLIASDEVESILPNSSSLASIDWDPEYGVHKIYAVIDPEDWIEESNEDNNLGANAVFVDAEVLEEISLSQQEFEAELTQNEGSWDLAQYAAELGYTDRLGANRRNYVDGTSATLGFLTSELNEIIFLAEYQGEDFNYGFLMEVREDKVIRLFSREGEAVLDLENETVTSSSSLQSDHHSCSCDRWHCGAACARFMVDLLDALDCLNCALKCAEVGPACVGTWDCLSCLWATGKFIGCWTNCYFYPCNWCSSDDCGTGAGWVGDPYCDDEDHNVHQVWEECICKNKGRIYQQCEVNYIDKVIEECPWGCEDGKCITPETRLTSNQFSSTEPAIAASGSNIHVVWVDERDGSKEVYYKRSTDNGATWTSDMLLSPAGSDSYYPDIAVSGNNVHVVWFDTRFSPEQEVYYRRSTDNGATFKAEVCLPNPGYADYSPSVAASGSNVHVVFHNYNPTAGSYEIYYTQSTDDGANWSYYDQRLTYNTGTSAEGEVAVDGNNVHVVWEDDREGSREVYYKRSADNGATWSSDMLLSPAGNDSYDPDIAVSGNNVHVVWFDTRSSPEQKVYYRRSTDNGATFKAEVRLPNPGYADYSPSVAASGSKVHVVFHNYNPTAGSYEIYYTRSTDDGANWSTYERLTSAAGTSAEADVGVSGVTVHVVWMDDRDGNWEIYYFKYRQP